MDRQDKIDSYIRGDMTVEQRQAFEAEMENDRLLAEETALTKSVSDKLSALAEKERLMAEWEQKRQQRPAAASGRHGRRWLIAAASIAACIVIGFFIGNGFFIGSGDQYKAAPPVAPPVAPPAAPPAVPYVRPKPQGAQTEIRGELPLSDITRMVYDQRYEEALQAIEKALADTVIDQSLPIEEQHEQQQVIKMTYDELTWQRIQILVGMKRKTEAIALLETYIQQGGVKQYAAEELLKELKEQE